MHELGVTQSILNIVLHHAKEADATRVKEVHLVIGELASIVDESVQFYWDMMSEGTIAHGATLNFTRVPGKLQCQDCQHEFPLNQRDYTCPNCGSKKVQVSGGDDFFIESIDVDLATETQSE